ncbi:MAG: YceH family protein [Acidobacteriota bacterium]
MEAIFDSVEVRVLGSLIEKAVTTPEYYPLSLNALTNACNQLTNREPIVSYDEKTVARGLESLREKKLIWMVSGAGARVPKYEHRFAEAYKLSEQEVAVMCVLMLRGPQTTGEIRGRTGRLYEFKELEEVELTLQALIGAALAVKLPRQPGTKESRYAHVLAGEVHLEEREAAAPRRLEAATLEVMAENERIARLEGKVERLELELSELKQQFLDFKKQFE